MPRASRTRTLAAVVAGAMTFTGAAGIALAPAAQAATAAESQMASQLVSQLNAERSARGVPGAAYNATLASEAQNYVNQVAAGSQPAQDPDYAWLQANTGNPTVYATVFGGPGGRALPSGTYTVGLMQSPEHQPWMMFAAHDLVGAGVACGSNGNTYVVEFFGDTSRSFGPLPPFQAQPIVTSSSSGTSCQGSTPPPTPAPTPPPTAPRPPPTPAPTPPPGPGPTPNPQPSPTPGRGTPPAVTSPGSAGGTNPTGTTVAPGVGANGTPTTSVDPTATTTSIDTSGISNPTSPGGPTGAGAHQAAGTNLNLARHPSSGPPWLLLGLIVICLGGIAALVAVQMRKRAAL